MINDFDALLAQCKTRALKKALRIALRILGSIALTSLGILGYYQWKTSLQEPIVIKPLPQTITAAIPQVKQEQNTTVVPATASPIVKTVTQTAPTSVAVPVNASTPIITPAPIASQPIATSKNRLLEVSNASANIMTPEQTYQRSPKFETALGIARDFFTKEEYAQAATWAKKANQMNREAEEAWLLYAKSYYAQGKKNEAIGVLELYLNYKDSKAASDLIKAWR